MNIKRRLLALLLVSALAITFSFSEGNKEASGDEKQEITVITHRTDIVDTKFQEYATEFNKLHPNITVNYESITDYEGEIKIRMNTTQYGDILMIPDTGLPASELPDFFEPLGTAENMAAKYEFSDGRAYEGLSYGISSVGTAQGILYNTEIFKAAGITTLPTTTDEFLAALQAVKAKTDAIPLYTNYAAGWPMGEQWEAQAPSLSGDSAWYNVKLPHTKEPWTEGQPYYILSKLLWDVVTMGLIEEDPTTTDWEASKPMLAKGEIATMVLGSWSIVQMQQAAISLGIDPSVIGYMPFPHTSTDGHMYSLVSSNKYYGINKNSKNKEAARLYLDWLTHESGYAAYDSGISPVKGDAFPDALAAFSELGVKFIENDPALVGEEALLDAIDQEAEIARWSQNYRVRILEAAIGNRDETFEDIMADLNAKWSKAMTTLGVE